MLLAWRADHKAAAVTLPMPRVRYAGYRALEEAFVRGGGREWG